MGKLVQGIGINDNTYPTQKDLALCDEYQQWSGMLFRCTQKYWNNKPTYIGTTCSENFKNYSFFMSGATHRLDLAIKMKMVRCGA